MRFKEQGNTAFRRDCYQDAVHAYTSALQDCDSLENVGTALLHDLHNNRYVTLAQHHTATHMCRYLEERLLLWHVAHGAA